MSPKPDLGRRLAAYLVDSILAGIAGFFVSLVVPAVGTLVTAGYMLLRDGLEMPGHDRRSFGKQLLKLRPVRLDGAPMDVETSMRRNWTLAVQSLIGAGVGFGWIPTFLGIAGILSALGTALFIYEIYRVLTDPDGRRWGDEIAHTQVVDVTVAEVG